VATGGGHIAADPRDPQGRKTLARIFQVDVEPLHPLGRPVLYGQRVHVRFDYPPQPLAAQCWRALRLLFIRHFET
jgi:putative peptide zinc metalloprotease protein